MHDILAPVIDPVEQAGYRYLLDIDGVASAWGFFEKLLLGSCVLKVASGYEQWFYPHVQPWTHYVPVRADLSDLIEQIEWCRQHETRAEAIACAGQAFALGYTLGRGVADLVSAARLARLDLDPSRDSCA